MHTYVHHHAKELRMTFPRSIPAHATVKAVATKKPLELVKPSPKANQVFSPLVQEFLDECGYSDK